MDICNHYWKPYGSVYGKKRYKCIHCGKTTTKEVKNLAEDENLILITDYEIFKSYIFGSSLRKLGKTLGKTKDQLHYITKSFLKNNPDVQIFSDFFTDRTIMADTIWQPIRNRKGKRKELFKGNLGFWIIQDALTGLIGGCYPTNRDVPSFTEDVIKAIKPREVIVDIRAEYKKISKQLEFVDFNFCMAHLSRALSREFLFLRRPRSKYAAVRNKVTEDEAQIEKALRDYLFKEDMEAYLKINDLVEKNINNINIQNFWKKLNKYTGFIQTGKKNRTTNRLEGFNSQVRSVMRQRRGLEKDSAYQHYQWYCFLHNVTRGNNGISPFELMLGYKLDIEPTWEDIVKQTYNYDKQIPDSQQFKKSLLNLRQSLYFHI